MPRASGTKALLHGSEYAEFQLSSQKGKFPAGPARQCTHVGLICSPACWPAFPCLLHILSSSPSETVTGWSPRGLSPNLDPVEPDVVEMPEVLSLWRSPPLSPAQPPGMGVGGACHVFLECSLLLSTPFWVRNSATTL